MDEPIALPLALVVCTWDKNLLSSGHVTGLMAVLQDKILSDDSSSLSFQKVLYLALTTAKLVRLSLWSSKVGAET